MSGKKRNIEDLLKEALVSTVEQPYKIPRNWVWSKLGYVFEQGKQQIQPTGSEKYIGLEHMKKGGGILEVGNTEGVKSKKVAFQKNDVLYGKLRPYLNKHAYVEFDGVASTDILVYRNNNIITNKLLNMYVGLPHVLQYANENSSGINLPRISPKDMNEIPFPFPPINEQKRIVEKVEHLLNKIEEAEELIEEAKETFELRRASILNKAFRGELTKKWRKENSFIEKEIGYSDNFSSINLTIPYALPDKWRWVQLKDVANFKTGYAFKSKDFVENGIQLVRMGNLYKNNLALERNPVYLPFDYDEKILERYAITNGDILLSLTGTKYKRDYGYAVKVKTLANPLLLNQRILSLRPRFVDEYVFYYLQSSTFRDAFFSFETGGVNQGNVGSKAVESILIPLPPIEEAEEIGKVLNELLENEKKSLNMLSTEENIETLKQSILSKAFRGELGTNDLSEESAIELLKEVLQEQVK